MLGIGFVDDLISKIGVPLVSKGIKALTGIDIEAKELTAEDKQKIMDSQIEIMKIDFEKLKESNRASEFVVVQDNANTADARNKDVKIQESANATKLAKNAPYYIDFIIVIATVCLGAALFAFEIPLANKELAYMMFGAMLTHCGTILNYHRGSSSGSASKQALIDKIKDKQ